MGNLHKNIMVPVSSETLKVRLRAANEGDLSNLRHWKNEQREFFFFKNEIMPEQQYEWFRAYQKRPEDFMFMVMAAEDAVGCMGIRLVDNLWDVYNVILGSKQFGGKGLMSRALQAMLCFAASRHNNQIALKVLKQSPAVDWYKKNGFFVTSEEKDFYSMSYQLEKTTQQIP